MTPKYRTSVSLKEFISLFEADAERTGGLKDENQNKKEHNEHGNQDSRAWRVDNGDHGRLVRP